MIKTANSKFDNKAMRTARDIVMLLLLCKVLRDAATLCAFQKMCWEQ
jgi:hypothetical protein